MVHLYYEWYVCGTLGCGCEHLYVGVIQQLCGVLESGGSKRFTLNEHFALNTCICTCVYVCMYGLNT